MIQILLLMLNIALATPNPVINKPIIKDENRGINKTKADLERKMDVLVKEINLAIKDAEDHLKNLTSIEDKLTFERIKELKNELVSVEVNKDGRRRRKRPEQTSTTEFQIPHFNMKDLYKVLNAKKRLFKDDEDRKHNLELIKDEYKQWFANKVIEHNKEKDKTSTTDNPAHPSTRTENCPREGNGQKRPCCRKCCKRSDLGCL